MPPNSSGKPPVCVTQGHRPLSTLLQGQAWDPTLSKLSEDGESSQAGNTQAQNVRWDHGGNVFSLPWPGRALRTVARAAEATGKRHRGGKEMKVAGRLPERARAPGAIRTRSQTTQGLLVTKEMILSKNELQSEAGLPSYKPERGQHASSTPGRGRVPGGNRRKDASHPAGGKGGQRAWAAASHTPVGCQIP